MLDQEKQAFLVSFGNRVKQLRIKKQMSLDELARKCGYTSDNARSSIQKIEAGKSDVPASKIELIAKALEVPVSVIMGWTDEWDSKYDTEKHSAEIAMWEFIDKQYGKATTEIIHNLLELKPKDQEKIGKLLERYSKLDGEDRIILFGRICQILEDMLSAEKYTSQKESSNGKAI